SGLEGCFIAGMPPWMGAPVARPVRAAGPTGSAPARSLRVSYRTPDSCCVGPVPWSTGERGLNGDESWSRGRVSRRVPAVVEPFKAMVPQAEGEAPGRDADLL